MSVIYYNDIDFSFDTNTQNDVQKLENIEAIKASIYNLLFIRENENFFDDFATVGIEDLLFEEVNGETVMMMRDVIENALENDERITAVNDINITFNEITYEYNVVLKLQFSNSIDIQEVDLTLKKTR